MALKRGIPVHCLLHGTNYTLNLAERATHIKTRSEKTSDVHYCFCDYELDFIKRQYNGADINFILSGDPAMDSGFLEHVLSTAKKNLLPDQVRGERVISFFGSNASDYTVDFDKSDETKLKHSMLETIIKAIEMSKAKTRLYIKPHPRIEQIHSYDIFKRYSFVTVLGTDTSSHILAAASDVVTGLPTNTLFPAFYFKKPILTVKAAAHLPGLKSLFDQANVTFFDPSSSKPLDLHRLSPSRREDPIIENTLGNKLDYSVCEWYRLEFLNAVMNEKTRKKYNPS
jgi:hypothetical protein